MHVQSQTIKLLINYLRNEIFSSYDKLAGILSLQFFKTLWSSKSLVRLIADDPFRIQVTSSNRRRFRKCSLSKSNNIMWLLSHSRYCLFVGTLRKHRGWRKWTFAGGRWRQKRDKNFSRILFLFQTALFFLSRLMSTAMHAANRCRLLALWLLKDL